MHVSANRKKVFENQRIDAHKFFTPFFLLPSSILYNLLLRLSPMQLLVLSYVIVLQLHHFYSSAAAARYGSS